MAVTRQVRGTQVLQGPQATQKSAGLSLAPAQPVSPQCLFGTSWDVSSLKDSWPNGPKGSNLSPVHPRGAGWGCRRSPGLWCSSTIHRAVTATSVPPQA